MTLRLAVLACLVAAPALAGGTFTTLHAFGGTAADPGAPISLISANGGLVGVTDPYGNLNQCCGTAYTLTTSGSETVVYAFKGGADATGASRLYDIGGVVYGLSVNGGQYNNGAIFTLAADGTEAILYSFKGGAQDGAAPTGFAQFGGALYGITFNGGANNGGTIFSFMPGGQENVLYSFPRKTGASPRFGLITIGDALIGTTSNVVFAYKPKTGKFSTIHQFNGKNGDLYFINGPLCLYDGKLYGTSGYGGAYSHGGIFSLTPGGSESVIYSFRGNFSPYALAALHGVLYGTQSFGHGNSGGSLYHLSPTGQHFGIVHAFTGTDGSGPFELVPVGNTLYGVTNGGGAYNYGTAFAYTP